MFISHMVYNHSNLIFVHSLWKFFIKRIHFLQQTYQSFMRSVFISTVIIGLSVIPHLLFSQQNNETTWNDSTLLPLLIIDTYGAEIPDEPRIKAHMGLIHNETGDYNKLEDPFSEYDGQISIERRGESSQYFYPKKSFSIETQNSDGSNNNVSLLGLPEENDFVLNAPYGDKSLMRNVLSYGLFDKFGHYSPRTRFVEVILNGDFQGLYVLTEKIKRDKNRVDIAKIVPKDTTAEDISGGYLLRIDKISSMEPYEYWESTVNPLFPEKNKIIYQFFDPDYYELTLAQRDYVKGYMQEFDEALVGDNFKDPATGYRSYLDIPSFVDLMILNEFTKDVDAFRLSHYFYKQKVTKGGKLVSGPPWDYNLTFGNSDFTTDFHLPENWIYPHRVAIYWWDRAMQDPWFANQLHCRWDELYETVMSPESMSAMIDSTYLALDRATERNFTRWPILGTYVWPNSFVGTSYGHEMGFLRIWIGDRLNWMNDRWGGMCLVASDQATQLISDPRLKVFPNPSDLSNTYLSLSHYSATELSIRLYDLSGKRVYQTEITYSGSEYAFPLPNLSFLPSGIYTLEVTDGQSLREITKLLKQ